MDRAVDPALFFDEAPCGFLLLDADWRVVRANARLLRWIGRDEAAVAGLHVRDLLDVGGRIFFETHFAPMVRIQGGFDEVALNFRREGGGVMPALVNAAERRGAAGAVEAVAMTVLNASDRRLYETELLSARDRLGALNAELEARVAAEVERRLAAEEELRHVQRVETIGALAGGIAHDFNNVLQTIARDPGAGPQVHEGVERGAALVRRLMGLARRDGEAPRTFDAARAVAGLRAMAEHAVGGEAVALEIDAGDAPLPVTADLRELENAVLNLAVNARDAMEGTPGTLRITARAAAPADLPEGLAGAFAAVAVEDTGPGMDADTLARAFGAFFTTKPEGRGTGLGLAMVDRFARRAGGRAAIRSAPGRGTTVTILLPLADPALLEPGPEPEASPAAAPALEPAAPLRVLLIEDDAIIRMGMADDLEMHGHAVTEAATGAAGIEAAAAGAFDVVVADLGLPDIGGPALVARMRALLPGAGIVAATGAVVLPFEVRDHVTHLPKPFDPETLCRAVAEAAPRG